MTEKAVSIHITGTESEVFIYVTKKKKSEFAEFNRSLLKEVSNSVLGKAL